jgi:hypothetical protein
LTFRDRGLLLRANPQYCGSRVGREPLGLVIKQGRPCLLIVTGGHALEIEPGDQFLNAAGPPPALGELYPSATRERLMSLLTIPGFSSLALRLGALKAMAKDALRHTPYTQLAKLTGQPAMSLPLHITPGGLPIGVQMIGAIGDECRLFSLAAQIEAEVRWQQHLPRWYREN